MRIYNGTKSQLDLPLTGTQRIQIPSRSVSGDILPNNEFLSLLVASYDYSEIALIVSGPYEINMCSQVSGAVGFVASSLEEAIVRFTPKSSTTPTPTPVKEEIKEEIKVEVVEEPKEEVAVEKTTEEQEVAPEENPNPKVVEEVKVEEPVKKVASKKAKKSTKKDKE